ncbi:hypothetical protein B0T21DRAFT_353993 [Apiosordaria backusii]|uniref:Uncharacterized protein n=1 Tax=Apiosordaria backusii TaxID=314023 RepID=A0AA40EXQ8_9PEZI|nr:hypothetical protein B0T21DRAFT_353993 [Apiosordaria backusii]
MHRSAIINYLGCLVLLLSSFALGVPRPIAHRRHHLQHRPALKRTETPIHTQKESTRSIKEPPKTVLPAPSDQTIVPTVAPISLRDVMESVEPTTTTTMTVVRTKTQTRTVISRPTVTRTVFGRLPMITGQNLNVGGVNGNGQVGYFED